MEFEGTLGGVAISDGHFRSTVIVASLHDPPRIGETLTVRSQTKSAIACLCLIRRGASAI